MSRYSLIDRRDPIAIENGTQAIVISCDSCGGIGEKENDILKVPLEIVGKFTLRVPLFEILSLGAKPISVSVTISNEPDQTGERLLSSIREELKSILGYLPPLVVSTEKNMKTSMTALGITIVGSVDEKDLIICENPFEHYGFLVGKPSVGGEVLEFISEIFDKRKLDMLMEIESVLEIIPCGSSGVYGELSSVSSHISNSIKSEISSSSFKDRICEILDNIGNKEVYKKSCGPSTAAIVIAGSDISDILGENSIRLW